MLVDLSAAGLQITQASDEIEAAWLDRSMLAPVLEHKEDGSWVLSVRNQGAHQKFEKVFIGSEIILADEDLVAILVGWHGNNPEKYGRLGYLTQKGQFYRYYARLGDVWGCVKWQHLSDELRLRVIDAVRNNGPAWAKSPGRIGRRQTYAPDHFTTYKVVRLIKGRYYSLHQPDLEYTLGQQYKQAARPAHKGGYYSHGTLAEGMEHLRLCAEVPVSFSTRASTPNVALLECKAGGRLIEYQGKWASTFLMPVKEVAVMVVCREHHASEKV